LGLCAAAGYWGGPVWYKSIEEDGLFQNPDGSSFDFVLCSSWVVVGLWRSLRLRMETEKRPYRFFLNRKKLVNFG
jgi:hypothetical protein